MTGILKVDQIQNNTGTSVMTFDGAGRITTPNQPRFHVKKLTTTTGHVAGTHHKITWEEKIYDSGNDFDLANNRFIAPIAGFYSFQYQTLLQGLANNSDNIHMSWFVNDAFRHWSALRTIGEAANSYYGYSGYLPAQGSINIYLNQNDTIDIRYNSSPNNMNVYAGGDWSYFTGFLVG